MTVPERRSVPSGLPVVSGDAAAVEQVVGDLEREPESLAVLAERRHVRVGEAAEAPAEPARARRGVRS